MRIKSVNFFPNGVAVVFDEDGQQVAEIQKQGWLEVYLAYLKECGADLDGCKFFMPDGKKVKLLKRTDGSGYKWEIFETSQQ
jgi:hypothetical protein